VSLSSLEPLSVQKKAPFAQAGPREQKNRRPFHGAPVFVCLLFLCFQSATPVIVGVVSLESDDWAQVAEGLLLCGLGSLALKTANLAGEGSLVEEALL